MFSPWTCATGMAASDVYRDCGDSSSGVQRLFRHQRDLLLQLEDAVLPVALRVEPGKRGGKRGIVPAPRDPRGIMDEAQRAQRLDQVQLAPVELHEVLVAGEQIAE